MMVLSYGMPRRSDARCGRYGCSLLGRHPFSVFPSSSPRFRVVGEHVKPSEAKHTIKFFVVLLLKTGMPFPKSLILIPR